jgi:hypothetical protein
MTHESVGTKQCGGEAAPHGRGFGRAALRGLLFLAAVLSAAPIAWTQTLGEQVNGAIKQAVVYLRSTQQEDGNFAGVARGAYPDGVAAFALLALVKSGVPRSDPAVKKAFSCLLYAPHTRTYSTAIRILALDAMKDEKYDPAIRVAADWLVENFRQKEKMWSYPDGAVDLSNTQYAILGLWAAERHGHRAPRELWTELVSGVVKHQKPDGGFCYRLGEESRGSMTCAGITVLLLCADRISKREIRRTGMREAIERAWRNIEGRFHPAGNPQGEHAFSSLHYYYYLYGLERVCAIGDRRKLGGRDWYREGASNLIKLQQDNGSWGTVEDTCFALLFLRLSTYTTIGRKANVGLGDTAGTKKNTVRPEAGIPFATRWLLLGPFDDRDESGLERSLINEKNTKAKKGNKTAGMRWIEYAGLGSRVDLHHAFAGKEHAIAYACCRLTVKEATDATIWFGSNDGARILLDGEVLYESHFRIDEPPDKNRIPVELSAATHCLLVKVANYAGTWGFFLRISNRDGSPPTDLVFHTAPRTPSSLDILSSRGPFLSAAEIDRLLDTDRKGKLTFDSEKEIKRVLIVHNRTSSIWRDFTPEHDGFRPPEGARGFLSLHPHDSQHPVRIYRKVRVATSRAQLVAFVAACHPEKCEGADWIARLGVFEENAVDTSAIDDGVDGESIRWLTTEVVSSGSKDSPAGWKKISAPIGAYAGGALLVVLECAAGGPRGEWFHEHAFIDEFSVR